MSTNQVTDGYSKLLSKDKVTLPLRLGVAGVMLMLGDEVGIVAVTVG